MDHRSCAHPWRVVSAALRHRAIATLREISGFARLSVLRQRVGASRSCSWASPVTSIAFGRTRPDKPSFRRRSTAPDLHRWSLPRKSARAPRPPRAQGSCSAAARSSMSRQRAFVRTDGRFGTRHGSGRHRRVSASGSEWISRQGIGRRNADWATGDRSTRRQEEEEVHASVDCHGTRDTVCLWSDGRGGGATRGRRWPKRRKPHNMMAAAIPLGSRVKVQSRSGRRMTATLMAVT